MKTVIKGFEEYIDNWTKADGIWDDKRMYKFENDWGASIIYHQGSYGYEQGLVELAVISWNKDGTEWCLSYDTEITNDIIGYLSQHEAAEILRKIKELTYNHNKEYSTQFDTKEEAELWLNPLTEAVQLPVEGGNDV